MRDWFETRFPEWNLPSRLVLKKYKEGWDEEFDQEKATYESVKPLQGIVLPHYYGELRYEGTRALLLSDIGGDNLTTPQASVFQEAELFRMLRAAFLALMSFNIVQGDLKLDNFHVVGDKIMAVDLEQVYKPGEDIARQSDHEAEFLLMSYRENQRAFLQDGNITVV